MAAKSFMIKKVIYVSPNTAVTCATDMMRKQGLRRLSVIENNKLVGTVTERTVAETSPSKVVTLSIYEMNYSFDKTKVRDVMIYGVVAVSPYVSLEDAIYTMTKNRVGIAPVVEGGQVYGVITGEDVFRAFLGISGHGEEGIHVAISASNATGTLIKIVDTISNDNPNVRRAVVTICKSRKAAIEIQIDGKADVADLYEKLLNQGIQVDTIELTETKSLDWLVI